MGLIAIELENWQQFSENNEPQKNQEVLNNVVEILQSHLEKGELLARWSENQFMILFPRVKGPKDPAKISKKIAQRN